MIAENEIPQAGNPLLAHLLETYASETNKVAAIWSEFNMGDPDFRPHPRSMTVLEVMRHELLSERRFFGEFLGSPEPPADAALPAVQTPATFVWQLFESTRPRLAYFAVKSDEWWLTRVPFFDVERQRIWIFWRRVLHTAHHRTQLSVYLRLMNKRVPSTYGPTADVTWSGADPTRTVEAAQRR
jgi:uncharacterized damage-inducible protein DinB